MRVMTEKLTAEGIERTKRTIKTTNYQKKSKTEKSKNKKMYQKFAQKTDKIKTNSKQNDNKTKMNQD